jgi:hypothetical protein
VAEALLKNLKGKKNGHCVASLVGRNNGSVSFRTHQDGFSKDFTAELKKQQFPPWREVVPNYEEGHVRVKLDAKYLKELAKAASDFGSEAITLYVDPKNELGPVAAVCRNIDTRQELVQVLMPLRYIPQPSGKTEEKRCHEQIRVRIGLPVEPFGLQAGRHTESSKA